MAHVWLASAVFALGTTGMASQAADPSVASVKGTFDVVRGFITKAAAQVPEDMYAFKPTPDVRSMGALFAHIADANFMICGMASGEKPSMSGIEKTKTTKQELTEALEASFKFCESAFAGLTGGRPNETVKFFLPGEHTRLGILAFNNAHDFEHYGNIVTYMRLKGMVPPSSAK
jgi:uncharacterized damage-inducible protein DinB